MRGTQIASLSPYLIFCVFTSEGLLENRLQFFVFFDQKQSNIGFPVKRFAVLEKGKSCGIIVAGLVHLFLFIVFQGIRYTLRGILVNRLDDDDLIGISAAQSGNTYAVNYMALSSNIDVKTVQHNLGHSTTDFTLKVYAHVTAQMQENAAESMERYIQSIGAEKGTNKGTTQN